MLYRKGYEQQEVRERWQRERMRNIILWALSTDVVVSGLNLSGLELHAIKSLVIEKQSFINEENSVCVLFIFTFRRNREWRLFERFGEKKTDIRDSSLLMFLS